MLADLTGEAVVLEEEEMACPECGSRMHRRGKKKRRLQAQGGEEIELDRHYAVCPNCDEGLFPLDKRLGLLPGGLTPHNLSR